MEYEKARAIKIKIITVFGNWAEEEGFEVSPRQEAELAEIIFDEIKEAIEK